MEWIMGGIAVVAAVVAIWGDGRAWARERGEQ